MVQLVLRSDSSIVRPGNVVVEAPEGPALFGRFDVGGMRMEGVPTGKRGRRLEGEVEWFGRGVRTEDGMRRDPKGVLEDGG